MKLGRLIAVALLATELGAQQPQGAAATPIDDLLRRAQDAFNDLQYSRADSIARQVLGLGARLTANQRTHAMLVIAASYYPEERSAQKPQLASATLRQLFRTNFGARFPLELTWPGLDSLAEEARRTTFGIDLTAEAQQVVVGPEGRARLSVRANRPASFRLLVLPGGGGAAIVLDSAGPLMRGEFQVPAMRGDRSLFTSTTYDVIISAVDSVSRDTVTIRYTMRAEVPALVFVTVPTKLDSTKLLPERTRRYGLKGVFAGAFAGGTAFALSSVLHAQGDVGSKAGVDAKGMGVAALLAATTMAAAYFDRGNPIPANIARNRAYVAAFDKEIADANAENRRRLVEHRTTLHFERERR